MTSLHILLLFSFYFSFFYFYFYLFCVFKKLFLSIVFLCFRLCISFASYSSGNDTITPLKNKQWLPLFYILTTRRSRIVRNGVRKTNPGVDGSWFSLNQWDPVTAQQIALRGEISITLKPIGLTYFPPPHFPSPHLTLQKKILVINIIYLLILY